MYTATVQKLTHTAARGSLIVLVPDFPTYPRRASGTSLRATLPWLKQASHPPPRTQFAFAVSLGGSDLLGSFDSRTSYIITCDIPTPATHKLVETTTHSTNITTCSEVCTRTKN